MKDSDRNVKQLIWIYFLLLIFEGALRKWILPGLSGPLLLARVPVLFAIYAMAASQGRFPRTAFLPWIIVLGLLSFLTSFAGHATVKVSVFGLHANFLHLPLIFLIPVYFDRDDVVKMGKWILLILLPMTVLAVMQFRAGPDARVNVGVGGEIGGQLYAASGRVRASGTFSFITGLVSFLAISASFLFYHFLEKGTFSKLLGWAALPALVLAVGVSGSRSAVLGVSIVIAAGGLVCLRRWEKFGPVFLRVFGVWLVYVVLSYTSLFREGLEVQRDRFESSGGMKVGIVERYFGEFTSALAMVEHVPLLGFGLGMGTNAGAAIMTKEKTFLLSEGEWGRVIQELGPILGLLYLGMRIGIILYAFQRGWRVLAREGNSLPILLLGISGMEMLNGQFGQATSLGFAVLGMGLTLAAANPPEEEEPKPSPAAPPPAKRIRPGRSAYAEALHGKTPE